MARHAPTDELEFPGADSFLDVVTNIVGILIILIVVLGARARFSAVKSPEMDAISREFSQDQQTAASLEEDVKSLESQIGQVGLELGARRDEREVVATLIEAATRDLTDRRGELNKTSQQNYDRNRELALAYADLKNLEEARDRVKQAPGMVAQIESYPTPISRTVDGRELHFQLKGGRLTYVPLEELLEKFKEAAPNKVQLLRDTHRVVDNVGPVDGFYMRYTLARRDIAFDPVARTSGGAVVELQRCEFLPTTIDQGETIDVALSAKSIFRGKLDQAQPGRWTITLWTYPDSFDAFRRLRKELFQRGFATAGRPLPDGIPISASPRGSKSAAE